MKRLIIAFGAVILLAFLFHPWLLNSLAHYLIVSDRLEKADLILVLGGDGNGERVNEAVKLFKQGLAPKILMTGGQLAWKLTYADWMKKQAVESGVPPAAILLQARSRSTFEDARFSLPQIKAHQISAIILVTSPPHTRRAARVFRKIFSPAGIRIIIHPVEQSEFNPDRWWTRHEDTALVVWEYVSAVLYFFKGY